MSGAHFPTRRVLGETVEVVNQNAALLKRQHDAVLEQGENQRVFEQRLDELTARVAQIERRDAAFRAMSFWDRVRWLLRGVEWSAVERPH